MASSFMGENPAPHGGHAVEVLDTVARNGGQQMLRIRAFGIDHAATRQPGFQREAPAGHVELREHAQSRIAWPAATMSGAEALGAVGADAHLRLAGRAARIEEAMRVRFDRGWNSPRRWRESGGGRT